MIAAIKPLRRPWFWLGLWCTAVLVVIVLCLIPVPALPQLPRNSDKVEHFLAYFVLAASAVQLWADRRALLRVALGLIALGIGIEVAQGTLTEARSADPIDAVANSVGVLIGMATVLTPFRDLLLRLQPRC